ncbi:MAG: LPS biosynthesis O-acetyl transferase [Anaerolineae bacterium]
MDNQAYHLDFARVGKDVVIWPLAKIVSPQTISIGDSVIIDDFVFMAGGAHTSLGSFVHIASHASLVGGGELLVGDFTGISSGSRVYSGNDDYLGGSLTGPTVPEPFRRAIRTRTIIGRHVIIGANCVILPGVTIGDGAAIGANSLVTKDCEPWTVYVGSPVRALKPRPSETMLALEAELRQALYDAQGNYIPKSERA